MNRERPNTGFSVNYNGHPIKIFETKAEAIEDCENRIKSCLTGTNNFTVEPYDNPKYYIKGNNDEE